MYKFCPDFATNKGQVIDCANENAGGYDDFLIWSLTQQTTDGDVWTRRHQDGKGDSNLEFTASITYDPGMLGLVWRDGDGECPRYDRGFSW
jgi:hypothetical protein